ncbi:MAG: dihydropteroate synthase [Planctomycetota bacterium]|jgi:cobalamin-dependent methionine synthase I
MRKPLIVIGESIHASIPRTGRMMKQLAELGPDAYSTPSEPLDYIKGLIESQAAEGARYIAVNLDAFGEDEPQIAVDMMLEYVKMVRRLGKGVPVCIDSSDDNVLTAGLKEWYNSEQDVRPPLINSIKVYTMDKMLPLKKDYDYAFVAMLMSESGKSHSIDELHSLAMHILEQATGKYGFKADEIFYDTTIFPLAIDMPMQPGEPGYTYKTFETISKIKSDPEMAGVHCTGGISNCARDLPARKIGVMRAFVHKAMEYGLDAAIANPAHHLGEGQADPDLLGLVDAYAKMDGSMENMNNAMMLMGKFCQESRKPGP